MDTSIDYSPWDQLPVAEPKTVRPGVDHFYQTTAKHLIGPTVKLMMTGLPIDLDRVEELESHLDEVLEGVRTTIENNHYVKEYLDFTYKEQVAAYQAEQQSKLKKPSDFLVPFKYNDPVHRSCFMEVYAEMQNISRPDDRLPNSDIAKWPANTVKKLAKGNLLLNKFITGQLKEGHPLVDKAVQKLAEYKCSLRNRSYLEKIHKPNVKMPTFNPQSSVDKRGIFEMLNIPSEASSSKTGLAKWDRAQIERVNREFSDDPDLVELTQAMIDHSFGAIVKNNFINAFYKYTVDGRLYGQYKLFGAKSFRYTSSNP